jgi:hypothetical protein
MIIITGEYILLRDVEHYGTSSTSGINSVQFRELDHHATAES